MSPALAPPSFSPAPFLRAGISLLMLACLGACGHKSSGSSSTAQRGQYKIGNPYSIDGITYTPREEFNHTETGVASWYGPGFHAKSTANGETYDQSDRTAAHRTLQMPSVVRVTNLENGLSTTVRVNDRGPFARSRVIDLSNAAARELDMTRAGTARVRIDQLPAESVAVKEVAIGGGGPAEQNQALARLATGAPSPVAVAQAPAPAPVYIPPPAAAPAVYTYTPSTPPVTVAAAAVPMTNASYGGSWNPPAPPGPTPSIASLATAPTLSGFYVQTGAFSTMTNAERQRGAIVTYGISEVSQASANGREVYRVRLGPYTTSEAAGIVADRLKRSGYGDARVVSE
jgi:peptidoglycan lytic transglycosylase